MATKTITINLNTQEREFIRTGLTMFLKKYSCVLDKDEIKMCNALKKKM